VAAAPPDGPTTSPVSTGTPQPQRHTIPVMVIRVWRPSPRPGRN